MIARKYHLPIQEFIGRKPIFSHKSEFFIIKIGRNGLPHGRFGVVISKRTAPKAVTRNRFRRIIFDFVRNFQKHQKPGLDFMISVLPKAISLNKKEFEDNLSKAFQEIEPKLQSR